MPWDNARAQTDTTDVLQWKIQTGNEKAYHQPLQTVHNSSEKSAGKNERKRKEKKTSDSTALR